MNQLAPIAYNTGTGKLCSLVPCTVEVKTSTTATLQLRARPGAGGELSLFFAVPAGQSTRFLVPVDCELYVTAETGGEAVISQIDMPYTAPSPHSARIILTDGTVPANGAWTNFPSETDGKNPSPFRSSCRMNAGRFGGGSAAEMRLLDPSGAVTYFSAFTGIENIQFSLHHSQTLQVRQTLGFDGVANPSVVVATWFSL